MVGLSPPRSNSVLPRLFTVWTLHDARGTFATRQRLAGLALDEIAEVMGWKRGRVSQVITREVEQDEIVRSWRPHPGERFGTENVQTTPK